MCFDNEINIPLSIPNTARPVCLNSDQPESPLSETNCSEQISPNAFYPLNLETSLSDTNSEIEQWICHINRKKNTKLDYANSYLIV